MNIPSSVTSSSSSALILRTAISEHASALIKVEDAPLTQSDLEQDLDAHRQNTVNDPERKNQRHRVDIQAQEPTARTRTGEQ